MNASAILQFVVSFYEGWTSSSPANVNPDHEVHRRLSRRVEPIKATRTNDEFAKDIL